MNSNKKILIIEDDHDLAGIMQKSFQRHDFSAEISDNLSDAKNIIKKFHPNYAVVDLKINNESGIDAVKYLHEFDPKIKIVVLTGYASITTTISAIKSGAHYYLAKPASIEMIIEAFEANDGKQTKSSVGSKVKSGAQSEGPEGLENVISENSENKIGSKIEGKKTSLKNIEWEHINRVLMENNFNISRSAKILNMHRRTLSRKLKKSIVK